MTAKDFLYSKYPLVKDRDELSCVIPDLIEFAKIHVKAALEAAAENADMDILNKSAKNPRVTVVTIVKDSILNAYPEDLIK